MRRVNKRTLRAEFKKIGVTNEFDVKTVGDMHFVLIEDWEPSPLWSSVQRICNEHNAVASGETDAVYQYHCRVSRKRKKSPID